MCSEYSISGHSFYMLHSQRFRIFQRRMNEENEKNIQYVHIHKIINEILITLSIILIG